MRRLYEAPLVDTPPAPDEMKVEQAAERLGQTTSAVRRACSTGALPSVRRHVPANPVKYAYWIKADDLARHQAYLEMRPFPMGMPKRDPRTLKPRPTGPVRRGRPPGSGVKKTTAAARAR